MDSMMEALKRKLEMIKGAVDELHQDIGGSGDLQEDAQEVQDGKPDETDPAKLDMAPSLDESKAPGAGDNGSNMDALKAIAGMGGHGGRGAMSLEERGANNAKGRLAQMKKN